MFVHYDSSMPISTARRIAEPLVAVGIVLMSHGFLPGQKESQSRAVETTRVVLEKWVETSRLIQKERADWALRRQILADRIELVRNQVVTLRRKIADADESIAVTDKKRAGLRRRIAGLNAATASIESVVGPLEQRTLGILRRMPAPIRDQVRMLSRLIARKAVARNGKKPGQGLGARFRNIIGILNEVNKWNRAIKITSEVRALSDGRKVEVATIYLGLGQAYYVTTKGDAAGIGTATKDGWIWKPDDEAATSIAKSIAIFQNKEVAAFVRLPIHIR